MWPQSVGRDMVALAMVVSGTWRVLSSYKVGSDNDACPVSISCKAWQAVENSISVAQTVQLNAYEEWRLVSGVAVWLTDPFKGFSMRLCLGNVACVVIILKGGSSTMLGVNMSTILLRVNMSVHC